MSGKDMFKKIKRKHGYPHVILEKQFMLQVLNLDGYWRNFVSSSSIKYVGKRRGRGGERLDGNREGGGRHWLGFHEVWFMADLCGKSVFCETKTQKIPNNDFIG